MRSMNKMSAEDIAKLKAVALSIPINNMLFLKNVGCANC